ncbi:MAG: class I SAM-dependent methyltransferase [gamma proteobacterium symbiont of Taylorina sp.]|nr:class I SAM-dependent methyltransferase [gamma proteobacterium symbiont of Taylorina sp.]
MENTRNKWNERYNKAYVPNQVIEVLELNQHLLSANGKSLDFACGLGGNALRMAELGYESHAWDISDSALEKLQEFAHERKIKLLAKQCDVSQEKLPLESFDVIIVSHFLIRDIVPSLIEALKPGGLIFYQTFCQKEEVCSEGPKNPRYRLKKNELLQLFADLTLCYYREEGIVGDITKGIRNEALLVAQKPFAQK